MLPALSGFFDVLRGRGFALAPAEALDAVRALAAVGVESREAVRSALRVTCAKDARAWAAFDQEFARYFAAPSRVGSGERGVGAGMGLAGGGADSGGAVPPSPARKPPRPRRDDEHRPAAARGHARNTPAVPLVRELRDLARARTARLSRVLLERGGGAAERSPAERPSPERPSSAPPSPERPRGEERAATGSGRRLEPGRAGRADQPLRRADLRASLAADVDRRLVDEALRMVAELRLRLGRRLEPGRRGRLALRRTLRRSLATAGVPFRLERATRRRRRPRVVLLLDVSRSVERAAGLFLLLAAGFLETVAGTRVYAFVDRAVECTRPLLAWARGGHGAGARAGEGPGTSTGGAASRAAFAHALGGVGGLSLDAASDYGRTFFALGGEPRLTGRDVVLVVLGDGRTNRFERLEWAFEDLARRARAVVWLVPERAATWGTGDSALGAYLPFADVAVEAANLAGLARGLEATLRRVHPAGMAGAGPGVAA